MTGRGKRDSSDAGAWQVYVVECRDGTFYTGIAIDLDRRLRQHDSGRGARYTRGRGPVILRHSERCGTRGEALRRELELKRLSRAGKQAIMRRNPLRRAGPGRRS
ncbi:MAG: GIY-YIG nuclease family protein [Pseudomonadota bacterium]|nr:GIY-YIG nuclease family protein [Pseudomonadota bacterium]